MKATESYSTQHHGCNIFFNIIDNITMQYNEHGRQMRMFLVEPIQSHRQHCVQASVHCGSICVVSQVINVLNPFSLSQAVLISVLVCALCLSLSCTPICLWNVFITCLRLFESRLLLHRHKLDENLIRSQESDLFSSLVPRLFWRLGMRLICSHTQSE